jgi:periplasmic copper chaperone A
MSIRTPLLIAALILAGAAHAQVTVQDPWVRGTVAQQRASGLFAVITSAAGGKLVAGSSPVAGVVEIHEMKMEGSTMKMRALTDGLPLPAGQAVSLQPGGYHVMLLDLKQQLKAGDTVPVTLVVEGADGQRQNVEVEAPVRPLGSAMGGGMGGHKH